MKNSLAPNHSHVLEEPLQGQDEVEPEVELYVRHLRHQLQPRVPLALPQDADRVLVRHQLVLYPVHDQHRARHLQGIALIVQGLLNQAGRAVPIQILRDLFQRQEGAEENEAAHWELGCDLEGNCSPNRPAKDDDIVGLEATGDEEVHDPAGILDNELGAGRPPTHRIAPVLHDEDAESELFADIVAEVVGAADILPIAVEEHHNFVRLEARQEHARNRISDLDELLGVLFLSLDHLRLRYILQARSLRFLLQSTIVGLHHPVTVLGCRCRNLDTLVLAEGAILQELV